MHAARLSSSLSSSELSSAAGRDSWSPLALACSEPSGTATPAPASSADADSSRFFQVNDRIEAKLKSWAEKTPIADIFLWRLVSSQYE